jgi:hypothetical protein
MSLLITTYGTLLKFTGPWRLAFAFGQCLLSYQQRLSWVCLHIDLQFISLFWETLCGNFCTGNFCILHMCQQMEIGEGEREQRWCFPIIHWLIWLNWQGNFSIWSWIYWWEEARMAKDWLNNCMLQAGYKCLNPFSTKTKSHWNIWWWQNSTWVLWNGIT